MPGTYCQRRTAIRITDPEVSWKMDNVLFLSDYELYHKPFAHDEEEEEDEFEDDGKKVRGNFLYQPSISPKLLNIPSPNPVDLEKKIDNTLMEQFQFQPDFRFSLWY